MPAARRKEATVTRARLLALLAALACGVCSPACADDLTETPTTFLVGTGPNSFHLDGLIVKKADAQGRLPIAIVTNGGGATATAVMRVCFAAFGRRSGCQSPPSSARRYTVSP